MEPGQTVSKQIRLGRNVGNSVKWLQKFGPTSCVLLDMFRYAESRGAVSPGFYLHTVSAWLSR